MGLGWVGERFVAMEKINNFIHTYQKCFRILNGICNIGRPFTMSEII
jgi:hypothetical protein